MSSQILTIFKPLLIELENMEENLDREEFMESALLLYNTLTVTDKNKILDFSNEKSQVKNQYENKNVTHHPKISKRSQQIIRDQELSNVKVEDRLKIQHDLKM